MRKLMLSLERECKFSKIYVFITSPTFISRSLEKEVKNQAFWDEAGSKIRLKNVLKCYSFFFLIIFDGFGVDLGRVRGVF